jgi:acyl transferase domain-containing protein
MNNSGERAIAIVGLGAILPDAMNVGSFWQNLLGKRYSIREVPPNRWRIADYYDPDPNAPDKTYSKIGSWVEGFEFDWKRYRIPPRVAAAMDEGQQWAVTIGEQALLDYGYPDRPLDTERTAVVLGTAMGGELHYITNLRISFPEYARALESVTEFGQLPPDIRKAIMQKWHDAVGAAFPPARRERAQSARRELHHRCRLRIQPGRL